MPKISIRISASDLDEIQKLADAYADGNLSAWIRFSAKNAPRGCRLFLCTNYNPNPNGNPNDNPNDNPKGSATQTTQAI